MYWTDMKESWMEIVVCGPGHKSGSSNRQIKISIEARA